MWTCLMRNGHDRRLVGGERATGQRGGGLFSMIKFVRWVCSWHLEASGVVEKVKNLIYPVKDVPYLVWERTRISILLYNTRVWARGLIYATKCSM